VKINTLAQKLDETGSLDALASLNERLDKVEAWLGPKLQGNWQGSNAMTQEWLQKLELASRGQLEKHDRRLKVVEAQTSQGTRPLRTLSWPRPSSR
jgi:hypothetical protein